MKALGLIIICVVLLATLQASYLIVEAKKPRKQPHIHVEDHTNDENDVSSSMHVTDEVKMPRHNKHHHREHNKDRDGPMNDGQVKEQLVHAFGSRIYSGGWKDRKHPNRIHDEFSIPAPNAFDDKTILERGEMDPNGILAEDIPIPKVDPPTTEHNVTEGINPVATLVKEPDTLPLYDQMVGDAPATDTDTDRDNHRKKILHADKKGNKHKFHKEKAAHHISCQTDADCEDGGCCQERKKGEKVCKPGGVKDIGRKCSSTCVCKTGLQCYVSSLNKKGKKRKHHLSKVEMGRCVDPDTDQNPGHFMTSAPGKTDKPVTPVHDLDV